MSHDLRSRAEHRARETAGDSRDAGGLSSEESQLLYDLRVHQIELEMQNEELRRTEANLEISRARYFDLYDLAPVGYLTVNEKGLVVEANLTASTLLGVARGALVKQPMSRFLVPEHQDSYYLFRKRLFGTGAPQVLDLKVRKADGTQFWARLEATTSLDADAATEVCRMVVSDITAQKRVEEERLQFEQELQQAQKADSLARMAGAIAHHFNNQLAVVMSSLELSMREPASSGDFLANAMLATRKAATISGLLLTYLGESHGNHAPLDLSDVCGQSLPMLRAAMPAAVALETDLSTPGPAVNGNANQLQLMMINLVTNAWEAVGDGESTIQLSVDTVPASEIPASHRLPPTWKPGGGMYACLEVIDAGCGIEDEEIQRIFDPFFTTKFTGRGLGLPVVLGILHAHRGGLVVESRRGRDSGSAFRAYLPISDELVAPAPTIAAAGQEDEGLENEHWAGTVLLAEDDDTLRWTLKTTLTRMGFSVLDAKHGVEAMELFRRHSDTIRLVVCDLTMPHLDGWETLAALRRLSPGMPVILTSGYDEADVMADERDEQPQAFLAKPYPHDALRRAIRRALGRP
ncbi:MAG TPA: response regulator [Vicinamibacterales bacterium]|nr:response regulator [Vicinamibacterales bacterium]